MLKKDLIKLEILDRQLDKAVASLGDHPFHNSMTISIGHALRNVRVNGHERKVSYPDIAEDFQDVTDSLDKVTKVLPKIIALIIKIKFILNKYKTCSSCKGKQILNAGGRIKNREPLEECAVCNGHGVILNT